MAQPYKLENLVPSPAPVEKTKTKADVVAEAYHPVLKAEPDGCLDLCGQAS